MAVLLVLVVLGFVPWGEYFGFDGFSKFLETLQSAKVADVSIFTAIFGKEIVEFGAFEVHNLALLLVVTSVVIAIIYKFFPVFVFFFRKKIGKIAPKYLRPFPTRLLGKMVKIGLPTAGENLTYNLYQTTLQYIDDFLAHVVCPKELLKVERVHLYNLLVAYRN